MANNLVFHVRTKHIDVHYHYVCKKVIVGEIDLVYVSTQDQVANIFIKILGVEKLQSFRSAMGVHDFGLSSRGSVDILSLAYDSPR